MQTADCILQTADCGKNADLGKMQTADQARGKMQIVSVFHARVMLLSSLFTFHHRA